jgi:hypothetical protein
MVALAVPSGDGHSDIRTEAALQARILRLCQRLKLRWYHQYNGECALTGFPDLIIVGPQGVLFWELKSPAGTLSEQQQLWADELKAAGAGYSVITPRDWVSGEVQHRLSVLADEDGLAA